MEKILEVRHLDVAFRMYADSSFSDGQRILKAIRNLHVTLCRGEIVAVIGSSGSGKSLLAHALMGILPKNAVYHLDMDFYGQKMALIPQSISYLDPLKKVGKQLSLGRLSKKELAAIAEHYELSAKDLDKYPFELSGGMARRILIATAFTSGADLIIADEPTPGLSTALSDEVLQHFRHFADKGKCVLLISHDIDLVSFVADRMIVLKDGEVVDALSTEDFRRGWESIRHPFTKALWRALPQNSFEPTPLEEIESQCARAEAKHA